MATVVTDPFDASIGYGSLQTSADIVTISHAAPGHGFAAAVAGEKRVIDGPGEFEIGGVFVTGIATDSQRRSAVGSPKRNTLYLFDFDGLTVGHLGDLDHVLSQAQVEALGAVHVALVPVGGGGGLGASQAAEVVSLIEPSVVVPMHYKTDRVNLRLDPVEKFLKEMGLSAIQPEPVLRISRSGLSDETRVVLLDIRPGQTDRP